MQTAINYIRERTNESAANSMPETYEIETRPVQRHDATGRQMSG